MSTPPSKTQAAAGTQAPASADCHIAKERDGERVVVRLAGVFDRASAWKLREHLEGESGSELVLDFAQVRDCSDLGVAVLAHGLARHGARVLFHGLRQHELRILRYCGVPVDETSAREAEAAPGSSWGTTGTTATTGGASDAIP